MDHSKYMDLSWNVSENENLLKPLSRAEMSIANSLIKERESGLFGVSSCKAENGATFQEVKVGKSGWNHRGNDFYSIKHGNNEIQTMSYSTAIRMFIKKASI